MVSMAITSYPFTSIVTYDEYDNPVYDRAVDADFMRDFYKKDRSNGVIMLGDSTSMIVNATNPPSRNITVATGYCFINGAYAYNDDAITLNLSTAPASANRIDTIVLRLDERINYRCIDAYIVEGTPAQVPTAPALTRTTDQYEIGIANIYIGAASSVVYQQNITDTRLDSARCGESLPRQEIDTTALYEQLQDQITRNIALIQSALDDTTAGHLQNQIDAINNKFYPVGSYYLSHSSTSPASLFGGTWVQLEDVVLRAANNTNTIGTDSYTKSYGVAIPEYRATCGIVAGSGASITNGFPYAEMYGDDAYVSHTETIHSRTEPYGLVAYYNNSLGDSSSYHNSSIYSQRVTQTHNNIPASQNMYVWRRTA